MSPLLANIFLNPLDHMMASDGMEMVRYADDFVILCRDAREAERVLEVTRKWAAEVELTLHPEKTRIVDARVGGFEFLGYHFERGRKWPREKSKKRFMDKVRTMTKRTNGHSLAKIIAMLNPTLRGWFNYFKWSQPGTFSRLDGWIRGRLRSILRKRAHLRGRGRGADHQKWPNAFFRETGLYSLTDAWQLLHPPPATG